MDDANAMEFFRAAKSRTYALLALRVGEQVLDVGCGAGEDVRALAEIVGPTGRAIGVDSSQTMVAAARERSVDSPLPVAFFPWVTLSISTFPTRHSTAAGQIASSST